jgi:hypothetical protein
MKGIVVRLGGTERSLGCVNLDHVVHYRFGEPESNGSGWGVGLVRVGFGQYR